MLSEGTYCGETVWRVGHWPAQHRLRMWKAVIAKCSGKPDLMKQAHIHLRHSTVPQVSRDGQPQPAAQQLSHPQWAQRPADLGYNFGGPNSS